MPETDRLEIKFIVKETMGAPSLEIAYMGGDSDVLSTKSNPKLLYLHCREGVSLEEAQRIARDLNDKIGQLHVLSF